MNKKLGRLFRFSIVPYLICMLAFCGITALIEQYVLAGVELVVTAVMFIVALLLQVDRKKKLKAYLEKALNEVQEVDRAKTPFPMAVVRLADGSIVYANDRLYNIFNLQDKLTERCLEDFLPGFDIGWITAGQREYPYDVTISGRRYRVYGTLLKADDPNETHLGVLYFADLTELYQVRDEYIRSRPVVSILLVDNYEEMTKNLSESAISTLTASAVASTASFLGSI